MEDTEKPKLTTERVVGLGIREHPCKLEPCTHTLIEIGMIRELARRLVWYCDGCNRKGIGLRAGLRRPRGWRDVYSSAKAKAPWGTVCPSCVEKFSKRKGVRCE